MLIIPNGSFLPDTWNPKESLRGELAPLQIITY